MSVINAVLKDLEKKPSAFIPLDVAELSVPTRPPTYSKFWIGLFVFIFVAVPTALYSLKDRGISPGSLVSSQQNLPTVDDRIIESQQLAETELVAETKSVQKQPVKAEVNKITGLQINETRAYMELEFQLTYKAQSFLKQRSKNKFVFQIKSTESIIVSPRLSDNPWLSKILISNVAEGVDIEFSTNEGVLVETRDIKQNDNHLWFIRFKTPQPVTRIQPLTATVDAQKMEINQVSDARRKVVIQEQEPVDQKPEVKKDIRLNITPVKKVGTDSLRLEKTLQALEQGQWAMAEKGLYDLLGSKQDRAARKKLIALLQQQEKIEQKLKLLDESIKKYPGDIDFILIEANRLFSSKQYAALITRFGNIQNNISLLSLVASSYQRMDQHDKAIEKFMQAIMLDPIQSKLWVSLAISQQQQGVLDQALHSYKMAINTGSLTTRLQAFVNQRIRQLSR
jgi:hypothetical protein